ncbi:DNA repair protein RadA [Marinobacter nanhaiticus D15-8W]|uniref:DNA repair protein RadA n=1 Tax=Marinobacter nanhaiticus D15-8W TaxID=626887 RepID=N6WNJ9_9GAMM|nr:DNA repair protein RadA [Marinobacter nanhaiticus]ENO12617.1 DNA repair protein RadA [Marinobacter nanhaiticus D15-8W]BES69955.1 DNA repair protein RadA [Marinobacter nanhaiticus D15-8W]
MAKTKTAYVCTECGAEYSKWQGQCNACNAWNTISEVRGVSSSSSGGQRGSRFEGFAGSLSGVQSLDSVSLAEQSRVSSGMKELDRVLGGGLVEGSAILMGGHPGAGKSTLLLQTVCHLAAQLPALYVTGEESMQQVALRAKRLGVPTKDLKMLSETSVERIIQVAETEKPRILVVDSIQVMHISDVESAPGSVSQVRESAAYLTRFAKQTGTILFLVGHVTKDGSLAGPKVLEHMIDCSILLEGSSDSRFRTLRGIKNRFGAVNELGVFAMLEQGLKEVKNPSAIFLNRGDEAAPGSVVMVVWEGTRPMLVEIQALVDVAQGSYPRRVAVGLDQNRLAMLLAVLHRHGGMHCADQDVFVNVVGGVKVSETSADLALLAAVVSSFRDKTLPQDLVIFGEVGLSGEIRPVPSGQERIYEASKHGFTRALVPKANVPRKPIENMKVIAVTKLSEALDALLDLAH